jgi:multiple sugar transport system substrate-binding protein
MCAPIPVDTDGKELDEVDPNAQKTEVFSYALPTWGSLIIRDNAKENIGKFGITTGPNSYFSGGTFMGISSYSKNKEAAWDFLKYCTVTESTADWWIEKSKGDVVSYLPSLESHKDMENEAFGGQKTYDFWLEQAKKVDYSLVTKYDDQMVKFFGQAIESIQKGEMSKEDALQDFYKNVKTVYPEIEVEN